jgi:hypothetical protein
MAERQDFKLQGGPATERLHEGREDGAEYAAV